MTTTFDALRRACGLSQQEAADLLGTQLATIKSWSQGRRSAPPRVLAQMAGYDIQIERAAAEAIKLVADRADPITAIELGVAVDDAEAATLGWPCVGLHVALIGRVAARLIAAGYRVSVVPRGSTVATAGAADAHETRATSIR